MGWTDRLCFGMYLLHQGMLLAMKIKAQCVCGAVLEIDMSDVFEDTADDWEIQLANPIEIVDLAIFAPIMLVEFQRKHQPCLDRSQSMGTVVELAEGDRVIKGTWNPFTPKQET